MFSSPTTYFVLVTPSEVHLLCHCSRLPEALVGPRLDFHSVTFSDFSLIPFLSPSVPDVACWRDGGKSAGSPSTSDQDEKLPGQDESTPGSSEQNDILKVVEKRIACGPPQAKLNGQQPALASQYRAMMPPYVSIAKSQVLK